MWIKGLMKVKNMKLEKNFKIKQVGIEIRVDAEINIQQNKVEVRVMYLDKLNKVLGSERANYWHQRFLNKKWKPFCYSEEVVLDTAYYKTLLANEPARVKIVLASLERDIKTIIKEVKTTSIYMIQQYKAMGFVE